MNRREQYNTTRREFKKEKQQEKQIIIIIRNTHLEMTDPDWPGDLSSSLRDEVAGS